MSTYVPAPLIDVRNQACWNLVWQGYIWQLHCPQDQPTPQEGFRIDPELNAVTVMRPAASRGDSSPQAILKIQHPSSLDYRTHKGLPFSFLLYRISMNSMRSHYIWFSNSFRCAHYSRVHPNQYMAGVSGGSNGSMEPLDFRERCNGTTRFLRFDAMELANF